MDELPQFKTNIFMTIRFVRGDVESIKVYFAAAWFTVMATKIYDITNGTSSRQVVNRSCHSLKYWTYGLNAGNALH